MNSKLIYECKMLLNVLGTHNKYKHICSVEGNERAVILIHNGSNSDMFLPEPALGISKNHLWFSRISSNISIRY